MSVKDNKNKDQIVNNQGTSHVQQSQRQTEPETVETKPERTAELLAELIALIRRTSEPREPAATPWEKCKSFAKTTTESVKTYWIWLPIICFLLAWVIYRFNPFYIFDKYKIASDESAAKLANIEYKEKALEYFIDLGNTLLSDGKSKDAAKAYEEAKKIDPFNIQAEYGLRKTSLLAFSEEKQFDPVVAAARFAEVEALAPEGVSAANDPHILYAKALFLWRTDTSPEGSNTVKTLLVKIEPEKNRHSAALGLLGEIALDEGDIESAIKSFDKALNISPHHWNYVNNLAYAHQCRADEFFRDGEIKEGQETIVKKAYPLYIRAMDLDPEVITPHIEVLRLSALLQLPSGHVDLKVDNLIAQIESDKLHLMEKNKEELFYNIDDPQRGERTVGIYSWKAKKAYLEQLHWLVNYFAPTIAAPDKRTIRQELAKIQETSIDGKMSLPWFLWNDLMALKDYNPEWVAQAKVAQKYAILLSIAKQK